MSSVPSVPCEESITLNAPNVVNGENYAVALGAVGGLIFAGIYVALLKIADMFYLYKNRNPSAVENTSPPVETRRHAPMDAAPHRSAIGPVSAQRRHRDGVHISDPVNDSQRYATPPLPPPSPPAPPSPPSPPPSAFSAQERGDHTVHKYVRGGMGIAEDNAPAPVAPPR